ncbi:MAG: hypothetical protein JSV52_00405 [Candidatus Zixiibacteriota bacterium]|nr:MAG: hypothetical protein JSV52_00405 [candidate division Zixibacteria bacterium]
MNQRSYNPGYGPTIILAAIFILSRIIYYLLGIRFDIEPLTYYWQYIDPELLRTDLLQSVFYLHSQPPLFNLFIGTVLKLFAGNEVMAFHLAYLLMGLILNLSLYILMIRLGLGNRLSLVLVGLFLISPACILYENFLFYSYPVATLLCLLALVLHSYLQFGKIRSLIIFSVLMLCLVLTRSLFHLVWLTAVFLILVYFRKAQWRSITITGALCVAVCLSLYVKNAYSFGTFSASSWFGMNFNRLTTQKLPYNERFRLVEEGKLSRFSLVDPFQPLEIYQRRIDFSLAPKTGHAVLDETLKSSGAPNLNNSTYLDISRQYARDAWYVLTHYPGTYVKSLLESSQIYCMPSSSYYFLEKNRRHISRLDKAYNLMLFGQFDYEEKVTERKTFFHTGLFLWLGYIFAIIYGFVLIRKSISGRDATAANTVTLLFIWFNLVYITVVGNAFELGENNRFRFLTEPMFLVCLGLAIKNIFNIEPSVEIPEGT